MTANKLERRLTTVSEEAFSFSALLKPNGEILEIDRQALAFWGLSEGDVKGKRIWDIGWRLTQDEDAGRLRSAVAAAASGRALRHEAAIWDTNRQATSLAFTLRPIKDGRGKVALLVANARNLTRRRQVEAALHRMLHDDTEAPVERARAAMDQLDQAVIVSDHSGRIEFANTIAGSVLRLDPASLAGKPLSDALRTAGADTAGLEEYLALAPETAQPNYRQDLLIEHDGRRVALRLSCSPVATAGSAAGYITMIHGNTSAVSGDARDPLTRLHTRPAMMEELDRLLTGSGDEHCFCYLDLDAFTQVDAQYGRDIANRALAAVAHELRTHARRGDMLARLGADEFALLFRNCSLQNAKPVADALLHAVQDARTTDVGTPAPQFTASAGLVSLRAADSATAVIQLAKHACLRAKEAGGNRLELHAGGEVRPHKKFSGLRTGRLRLLAQPLLALGADQVPAHAEVLLRVADAAGRLELPTAFLASADHANLMAEVDRWVIAQVFAHASRERESAGYSVNLSAQSVLDPALLPYVRDQRDHHGVAPERISFELDETLAFDEPRAHAVAEALRREGFIVALDDCGTSGRSIAQLRDLPVDYLKIGGGLVRALGDDAVDGVLVDAINRIGHLSGKRTVAKWVESDAVLAHVRRLELDYAQGFAVAEPTRIDRVLA